MDAKKLMIKARVFGDPINEDLAELLVANTTKEIKLKDRENIASFFNQLLAAKEAAKLST